MVIVWQCQTRPMPIAFCWFGSYRWFPSIRRLQSSGRRQSSAGIARGWGIFAVSQSCWQAENLGRIAQAHWRDEAVQITSRVRPHIHGELLNLIRDPDTAYGPLFVRRLRAMGIRDKPIAPRSPWQNPTVAERVESRFASALGRGCVPWAIALVRDRRLGVRRVCRVLLDAADEIERGVQRLVVLRIRRDIGLRAGLLVAFGLKVSAQRRLAARVGARFELLRHVLQHLNVGRDALRLDRASRRGEVARGCQ